MTIVKAFSLRPALTALACVIALTLVSLSTVQASNAKTLNLTPLTVNAQSSLDTLKAGIDQMLFSRLSWRGQVRVIPMAETETIWNQGQDMTFTDKVKYFSETTGTDYILTGSITELAGSYSLDVKVVDVANARVATFFQYSKTEDGVIDKIDRIAAEINQKIFKRSTYTWEQMQAEKKADLERIKRQNPEHLMRRPEPGEQKGSIVKGIWDRLF